MQGENKFFKCAPSAVYHLCVTWQLSKWVHPPDTTLMQQQHHQLYKASESPSFSSFPPGRAASAAAPPSCFWGQWHPQASRQQVPPWERHANHEGELACFAQAHNVFIKKNAAPSSQKRSLGQSQLLTWQITRLFERCSPICVHHTALNYIRPTKTQPCMNE